MNMITLMDDVLDAISLDTEVRTWAKATYGQDPYIYLGTDPRQSPDESKYPLVAIFPVGKEGGYASMDIIHDIDIVCGIIQEGYTITGLNNIIKYKGIEEIELFRKFIEIAITDASLGGRIDGLKIIYEPLEFFPFFLSGMTIRIVEDLVQGGDPFA